MAMRTKESTGLDELDPRSIPARDAKHFREILRANEQLSAARQGLADAVRRAREAGDSWTVIGAALGVSRQAAQERFGR